MRVAREMSVWIRSFFFLSSRMVTGQAYWIEVVPSAQSREFWETSPLGITGTHLAIDAYSGFYYPDMIQGAFEIYLIP